MSPLNVAFDNKTAKMKRGKEATQNGIFKIPSECFYPCSGSEDFVLYSKQVLRSLKTLLWLRLHCHWNRISLKEIYT